MGSEVDVCLGEGRDIDMKALKNLVTNYPRRAVNETPNERFQTVNNL